MRCGCYALILAIGLIVWGGQGLYEAIAHGKQKVVTYDQFVKAHPKEGWYKITGCVLSLPGSAYVEKYGRVSEVYVPVYDARKDAPDEPKVFLLLNSENEAFLDPLSEMNKMDDKLTTEAKANEYMEKNKERLFPKRDLEGMLQFGVSVSSKDRSKLASLNSDLAPDFVILQDGKRPSLLSAMGMLVGGVVLLGIILVGFIGKNQNENETA